jgi:hypothetical protein
MAELVGLHLLAATDGEGKGAMVLRMVDLLLSAAPVHIGGGSSRWCCLSSAAFRRRCLFFRSICSRQCLSAEVSGEEQDISEKCNSNLVAVLLGGACTAFLCLGNVRDLEVEHDVVVEYAVCSHPAMRSAQGCSCKIVLLRKLCYRNLVVSCCFFPS